MNRERKDSRYICPVHNELLIASETRYGLRGDCPVKGCTVVLWYNDTTAIPADKETREARIALHKVFDKYWKRGKINRGEAYRRLAALFGLSIEEAHIGRLSKEQCEKAITEIDKAMIRKKR